MARPLICPGCHEDFTFAEWSRAAACPHCGRRVSFFAATGQPDPVAAALAAGEPSRWLPAGGAAVTAAAPPAAAPSRVLGKPLAWARGWTVVVAIWLVLAALLTAARVEMGHLSVFSARETAAIAAVSRAPAVEGMTTAQALGVIQRSDASILSLVGQKARAYWYVFDRPWEHKVYVIWELDDPAAGPLRLAWTVQGARVTPDGATAQELARVPELLKKEQQGPTAQPVTIPGL